jgi:hypothetical protein
VDLTIERNISFELTFLGAVFFCSMHFWIVVGFVGVHACMAVAFLDDENELNMSTRMNNDSVLFFHNNDE